MTDKPFIDQIENEIFDKWVHWTDEFPGKPNIVIHFSPEGYNRARADKVSSCYFSNPMNAVEQDSTFAGYPYAVIDGQHSLFRVKVEGL